METLGNTGGSCAVVRGREGAERTGESNFEEAKEKRSSRLQPDYSAQSRQPRSASIRRG